MTRTVPSAAPRLLAVLAGVLIAVPVAPVGAVAEPSAPALTWAVQPANQQGPDGRRWVERTVDRGQMVTEHLAVRNFSDRAVTFALKAADGYLTDKGRFNMLPSDRPSVDGGTWITVQAKVSVGAKETKVVPFTITVPRDARPGDHPAGIAATITATGGTVAVESRVGFRVMMRVNGTLTAAVGIHDLTAAYRHSWNPFSGGTVRVTYTATNDGNVAVTGSGRVTSAGPFGLREREAAAGVEEMLPGGSRTVAVDTAGAWPFGRLRTRVEVTPAVNGGDPAGAEIRPAAATVTVWALPWPQLAFAVALAAVVLAVRFLIRRRRKRLAELLARARDQGRAEGRGARERAAGG
jgi:hypothetical protein